MAQTRTAFRPWMLVTIFALIYALGLVGASGDPLALVTLGTRFSGGTESDWTDEGYDGQFVYFIARDPANASAHLDVPAYRYQRLLLPAAGYIGSLGQEVLIPWALLAVNITALAVGTLLMERLLQERGVSRWYALSYGLTLGTAGALRLSLPEPLAYGLALGGIVLALRGRLLASGLLFALAALAKETTLVLAAGYGLWLLSQRRWRDALLFGAIAVGPFVVLQVGLYAWLGEFGVGSGGALATRFEIIPFAGVVRILTEGGVQIFLVLSVVLIPFVLIPTVWGALQVISDFRRGKTTPATWLLLATAAIMPFVPFSTYREPVGILRFIVGLQIAVLLYAAERRNGRVLLNSTIWILTTAFVVYSDMVALTGE